LTAELRLLDPAPAFSGRNQYGETVSCDGLRGRAAVLVFFPWAFSRICGAELAELRIRAADFEAADVRLIGLSCDSMFALRAYADSERLTFDLVSDHWPHGSISRAFGVFDETAGCALRGSFVLDGAGRITWQVVQPIEFRRDIAAHLAAARAA